VQDYDAVAILGAVATAGATHEATVLVLEAVLPMARTSTGRRRST